MTLALVRHDKLLNVPVTDVNAETEAFVKEIELAVTLANTPFDDVILSNCVCMFVCRPLKQFNTLALRPLMKQVFRIPEVILQAFIFEKLLDQYKCI